jgi:preprotein translocase subunit SecY
MSDFAAMWQASGLKEKLIFTGVALAVFRLGAQIPIWGVNSAALRHMASNQLLGFLDMFSGGALGHLSVLALGIGPYITASIIIQLLTVVIPRLEELQKDEGEAGRRKISQYTRYLTVVLAIVQGTLVVRLFSSAPGIVNPDVPLAIFYPAAVLSLVAGSMFALWLAEMITERGVGNGGSLLILVGILSRIPFYVTQTATLVGTDPARSFNLVALMAIYLVTIGLIIVLQEAVRKIFIVSAKRQVGNRIYGGQNTYIPFKINPSGVMPIIFTFAVMTFPATLIQLLQQSQPTGWIKDFIFYYQRFLGPSTLGYIAIEFLLIIFFSFFYTSIIPSMQPREIAEQLKKHGSSIPGIKPGKPTSDKLEEVLSRTTLIGAVALAIITLIATFSTHVTNITTLQGLGTTSLIIMVGVALDTMNQIRVHMLARQYEGFLK